MAYNTLPQHFMDELRRRSQLSSIVGRHVKLVKKGDRHIGLCPFHKEKTPSFNVRDHEGYYHCFGCGVSGDAINFLKEQEGLGFMEAVRTLADAAGLQVPNLKPHDPKQKEKLDKNRAILEAATRIYQSHLQSYLQSYLRGDKNPAADYLKKRGLDAKAIETFRLGFAPNHGLLEALMQLGHQRQDIIASGLVRISEHDQSLYQMFRNRLMFPITDHKAQVIAFGGRTLDDDQNPKYINSAESPLFQKKHVLYGMHLLRPALRHAARPNLPPNLPLVVAEGYMDVIAIHRSGLAAATAPLGTALTIEQIKALWRLHDQPILCFDGDTAGKAAALKALIRSLPVLEPGKTLRLALMPPGCDPDQMLKDQNTKAFAEILDNTLSWMDGLWDGTAAKFNLNEPEHRAAFWHEIKNHLKDISNGQMRASISDEVERRITIMRNMLKTHGTQTVAAQYNKTQRPKPHKAGRARIILALLINHPNLMHEFYEKLTILQFHDEKMEKLRQTAINILSQHPDLETEALCHHLSEHGYNQIAGAALLKGMENLIRFDPATINKNDAKQKLDELITLEAKRKTKNTGGKKITQTKHQRNQQTQI